jgi:hypothetical protein
LTSHEHGKHFCDYTRHTPDAKDSVFEAKPTGREREAENMTRLALVLGGAGASASSILHFQNAKLSANIGSTDPPRFP